MEVLINFFTLRPTFHRHRAESRLVHLFVEYFYSDLHCRFWNFQSAGAERNKFRCVAAKFFSTSPRTDCATRDRSVAFGGSRYNYFQFAVK